MFSLGSVSGRLLSAERPIWQQNRLLDVSPSLQLFGCLVILLSAFIWPLADDQVGPLKILLVLVTGWAVFRHGRQLLRSPVAWLFGASVLIQILTWVAILQEHPEFAESSPKLHRFGNWFAFAAIACWLGGSVRNTLLLWSVALVALLLAPWVVGGGFAEWAAGATGQRIDFGLHNAQHTALLFGTALLGLIVLAPRLFRAVKPLSVFGFLWLVAVAICLLAVLYSQTRGVWLGLSLAVLFLGIAALRAAFIRWGAKSWPRLAVISVLSVAALVAVGAKFGGIIVERLDYERETIDAVMAGDFDSAPFTSTGIRLHTWMEALPWIQERPLLGWGGKGRSLVIEQSATMPQHLKDSFGHLHNSYLDLQVNNGLLGSLLLLALVGWLLIGSVKTWRRGELPGDLLLFFLCFTLFWLVINCFESYLFFASGSYVFGLVCAGIATQILRADFPRQSAE
ncbi:O-antigen ligase [Microbulbifer donghaiensis]|uniref:O-antigen ligase n=1 Tax=Microbulbifer donghaiensis TaxID=494016 RepID=A0A1M5F7Y1_9GAMM|nr:O-antigen ligase family protein [Microbulbifer donghaiensis]SHF87579.1 O-antigen ligase [Microbulbifer donghaiensis]